MRTFAVAMLIVLAFASFASAQVAFTPTADLAFTNHKVIAPSGDAMIESSYTVINLGVDADFGNGIVAEGTMGLGFGGDFEYVGLGTIEVDRNTFTRLRIGARYTAYGADSFAVGPVVNYQSFTSKVEYEGMPNTSSLIAGIGIGGFVTADFDPISLLASYIYRPSVNVTYKEDDVVEAEESGSGSTLTVNAFYPVSDQLTITLGYEHDTIIVYEDDFKDGFSAFKAGVMFAF